MKFLFLSLVLLTFLSNAQATEVDCPARYPNGNRLIDGDVLRYPNGNRIKDGDVWRYPNGNRVVDGDVWRYENGNRIIDGDVWRYENGNRVKDGQIIRYENGNRAREADGVMRDRNGNRLEGGLIRIRNSFGGSHSLEFFVRPTSLSFELSIQYDEQTRISLQYADGIASSQPSKISCEILGGGENNRDFTILSPVGRVSVQTSEGYDPIAVKKALEEALKRLEH